MFGIGGRVYRVRQGGAADIVTPQALNRSIQVLGREDAPGLQFSPPKIEKQANGQIGGLQVVNHLGDFIIGHLVAEGLDFHDYLTVNKQIQEKFGHASIFMPDFQPELSFSGDALLGQFSCQCAFVNFFFVTRSQGVMDSHRGSDDAVGQIVASRILHKGRHALIIYHKRSPENEASRRPAFVDGRSGEAVNE